MRQDFRFHFPMGTPADYEPEMREKFKALILENGGYDRDVLARFLSDERTSAWQKSYFTAHIKLNDPGSNPAIDWIKAVRNEVTNPTQVPVPTTVDPQTPIPTDFTATPANTLPDIQPLDDLLIHQVNHTPIVPERPKTDSHQLLNPEPPKLLTAKDFENALRQRFSSDRLTQAWDTLNRHGPQEGLRRLKQSDPDIATHVERLMENNKDGNYSDH